MMHSKEDLSSIEFNGMRLAYKVIHFVNWPSINHMEYKTTGYIFCNSNDLKMMPSLVKGAFQNHPSKKFNKLSFYILHEKTFSLSVTVYRKSYLCTLTKD